MAFVIVVVSLPYLLCVFSAVLRGYAQEVESGDRRHLRDTPSSFSGHMGAGTLHPFSLAYPSTPTLTHRLLSHPRSQLSHLAHLNSSFLHLSAVFYSRFFHFGSTISSLFFPPSFPPFSFPPLPRPGASPLHGPPEGGSTAAVHGAFGQTHVQCLRRLVCHSSTSSKGWYIALFQYSVKFVEPKP